MSPVPVVSISNAAAVTEGGDSVFDVTLSAAPSSTVTVNYSTASGVDPNGADSGTDFTAVTNQSLTFTPGGSLTQQISISTIDDAVNESAEEFGVTLSNASGATIGTAQATGTINDNDDALPTVSISNATAVTEGGDSIFTVSLSAASTNTVTVNYSTADEQGPNGATGGNDFVAESDKTLTFTPGGSLTQQIAISTIDDVTSENTETFTVALSNPSGATLSGSPGTGTINDNDSVPLPTLSISDAPTVTEGSNSVFTVTLSANPTSAVTVNFATSPTGPNPATSGSDFVAQSSSLTFSPGGSLTQQISVSTIDDVSVESSETLQVALNTAVGATISTASAIGTIDDNDVAGGNGTLHGRKFHDLNVNGTWESGEPWLNGWTIELVNAAGNVVAQQVTADMDLNGDNTIDPATESGWYWFSAAPGTYTLQEVAQDGWQQTTPASRLPALAYQLDSQLLFRETTNEFEDWGGLGEKWLLADGNVWYYITPDGSLYEWDAVSGRDNLTGTLVDSFSPDYHADLALLYDAAPAQFTTYTLVSGQTHSDVNFGNVELDNPGSIHGRKWNDLNGDGQRSSDEPWMNGWTIELVDFNGSVVQTTTTMDMDIDGNGSITPETESGWYWLNDVAIGDWTVREVAQPGWHQTAPADPMALEVFELDTELNLRFSRSLFPNWGGLNERWMLGDDQWYFITPNGDLFRWNSSPSDNLSGNLVAQLSPEYHANPASLYDAQNPFVAYLRVNPGETVTGVNFGNQQDDVPNPDPTNFAGAGNVAARIFGNNLILTGDNAANGVMVSTNQDGWVTVIGLGDTTIAGHNQPWVIDGWTMVPGDL
ncbi:MAG: Calx-beta domain-containing protein, partial [Fuerstiella sp.]